MSNMKKTLNDTLDSFRDGYEVEHKKDRKRVYDARRIVWRLNHPVYSRCWLFLRVQVFKPINKFLRRYIAVLARKVKK